MQLLFLKIIMWWTHNGAMEHTMVFAEGDSRTLV